MVPIWVPQPTTTPNISVANRCDTEVQPACTSVYHRSDLGKRTFSLGNVGFLGLISDHPYPCLALRINTMSPSIQTSSPSTSSFQQIFDKALEEYKKKSGKDLTSHPLAAQIKGCNSPEAILSVLEGKANELNRSRSSDDRLTKLLNPTVNIINVLSATLGQATGLVSYRTRLHSA
jgi:hypothetical protein